MSRPSVHNPVTKSYAIDQIDDIEHLRRTAHRMWEAFSACHAQSAHIIGALASGECKQCEDAIYGDAEEPCERYREWQKKITDGFGSV